MSPVAPRGASLSVYHFNLQYNAGNLKSYHVLIQKSFRPFLDFYMTYPMFKASCEIQGHAVAFMARFYPEELEKLRTLVMDRKQLELVSVHYSDQVYLAYPRRDLVESMRINDETLARYGLARGGTFFAQENFFGPGVVPVMRDNGYRVALLNRHYLRHYQGDLPACPFYEKDGVYFIPQGRSQPVEGPGGLAVPGLTFDYWGDGELAFTRGNNYFPFHGPSETKRLKRLALYIGRHKDGFQTMHCTDYIDWLLDLGVKPEPLPPVLDGSWNYPSYGGVYLWMGRYRLPWERDGYVRSGTFRARALLLAAEILARQAHGDALPPATAIDMTMAWKHLLLAEVSDSTGQTPVPTEVKYSFMETKLARKRAARVIASAKAALGIEPGTKVLVDTAAGTVDPLTPAALVSHLEAEQGIPSSLQSLATTFPGVAFSALGMKRCKVSVRARPGGGLHEHLLHLEFRGRPTRVLARIMSIARSNANFPYHAWYNTHFANLAGISFKLLEPRLVFSPALLEDEILDMPLDAFRIHETTGLTYLPLPNGLLGLGKDTYIIKHNLHGNTHIAATIDVKKHAAGFIQDGPPSELRSSWTFSLVRGDRAAALARANELNVRPRVVA